MPYVRKETRELLDDTANWVPSTPGELSYVITMNVLDYLPTPPTYADLSELVGVLECTKQEIIRRMLNPLENLKIVENGDVFP